MNLWVFISKPVKMGDVAILDTIFDKYEDLVVVIGTHPLMRVETENTKQAFAYLEELMTTFPYLGVTVHRQ